MPNFPAPDSSSTGGAAEASTPARRTVVRGIAAAGILGAGGALLSACGGEDAAPSTGAAPATTPAPGSPAPSASSSAPATGAPAAETVIAADKVPVGGGVIVESRGVVVTQPEAGTFKAFSSMCTHQRCPVTRVRDGLIECSCHGSTFAVADGSVRRGPATAPLPAEPVTVANGQIVKS